MRATAGWLAGLFVVIPIALAACSGDDENLGESGTGGAAGHAGTGGASGSGGNHTGGGPATGGSPGTGGASSGGATGAGGDDAATGSGGAGDAAATDAAGGNGGDASGGSAGADAAVEASTGGAAGAGGSSEAGADHGPVVFTSKASFGVGQPIPVAWAFGPGHALDWVGIFHQGDTPGTQIAVSRAYAKEGDAGASGVTSGAVMLTVGTPGAYFIGYFADDAFSELSPRVTITVSTADGGAPGPVVFLPKSSFAPGENIPIAWAFGPGNPLDWVGVYKSGEVPSVDVPSMQWVYTPPKLGVTLVDHYDAPLAMTEPGSYFAGYFVDDSYTDLAPRVSFTVGGN
jgi:hypothetical protein